MKGEGRCLRANLFERVEDFRAVERLARYGGDGEHSMTLVDRELANLSISFKQGLSQSSQFLIMMQSRLAEYDL